MKKIIPSLFMVIFLSWNSGSGREIPLTILHTTDLHGNILSVMDYDGNKNVGGFARCSWMIKKIRSENKNVLLVDAGDLYQGSPFAYLTHGSVMVKAIDLLKYDSWTLGNHEFDWGIENLGARIRDSKVPVLAANLQFLSNSKVSPETQKALTEVHPYIIRDVEGVKIGIVGLTTPGIPNWSRPRLIPGITIEDSVDCLKKIIPKMKSEGCDMLILATHQAYQERGDDHANQIHAIAKTFPELDVIVGGHSHRLFPSLHLQKTLYTQAAYWGTYLGKTDLIYDTDSKKIKSRRATAIKMDSEIPMDQELIETFKKEIDDTEKELNQTIGETKGTLHSFGGPKKETPVFNLICSAIAEKLKSMNDPIDAVIHGTLNRRAIIQTGPVTLRDVYEMIPYENTVGTFSVTLSQFREILEENAAAYQSERFRGLWGFQMSLQPSASEQNRLQFLGDEKGNPLDPNKKFRIALNSYDLASGGNRWRKLNKIIDSQEANLIEYDFQTRETVAEFIRKHSPIKPEIKVWWKILRKKSTP